MTPTPQQIRSETYQLDRAADALADLDHAPLSESVVSIRAISKLLNKLANNLTDTTPYKLKLGYVANASEVKLVKQIGCTYARVQGWPGGANDIIEAFAHGIEVAVRIAREYIPNTTSRALDPLTTDAMRNMMTTKVAADIAVYKSHGVKQIILGNEPDGKKKVDGVSVPRYWTGAIDRFGTDWARHIAPLVRAAGIRVGFGLPIFATATAKFAADLVSSGAYKAGDFFAANVYGANATEHHSRKSNHIAALMHIPTFNPVTDFEISEAGLQTEGKVTAGVWLAEFAKVIDIYRSTKFPGAVSIYRIDENGEAPFAPFKDGKATATLDEWKGIAA